jgi:hypothetical protein
VIEPEHLAEFKRSVLVEVPVVASKFRWVPERKAR